MDQTVLIVESPNKIKKISALLGPGYRIMASVGHFRDLPRKEMGVSPPDYRPSYVVTKPDVLKKLKAAVKGSANVYLATDPDREGEAIAWHLQQALGLQDAKRVAFQEITGEALRQALERPRQVDLNLVRAQEARRVLDRLVGYRVSGVLRDLTGHALSAGRVQTPAIRLVVDREREIRAFRPVTHYGVEILFETDGLPWKAEWFYKPWLPDGQEYWLNEGYAQQVAGFRQFRVTEIETREKRTRPPAPFTTSTLQQAASTRLRMRPKQTMDLAQQLFAAGFITYHRTDSPNLSEEAIDSIREQLAAKGLAEWAAESPNRWKSKAGAQEAHEAIRPTNFAKEDLASEVDEAAARLYRLIWEWAMASQMKDAVDEVTKVTLKSSMVTPEGRIHLFIANGKVPVFDGWRRLYAEAQDPDQKQEEEAPLPRLQEGQCLEACDGRVVRKQTKPPLRYTEASLVKALEKRGIGRPSTYASIMETLHVRGYVTEEKRRLAPTELAFAVIEALEGKFEFVEYDYTKEIEERLDRIAQGKHSYLDLVSSVDRKLDEELGGLSSSRIGDAPVFECPECGSPLRKRKGRNGHFWGCSGYPECRFTAPDEKGKPRILSEADQKAYPCPECGEGFLQRRKGRNGHFWGCSRYPECKHTAPDDKGKPGKRQPRQAAERHMAGQSCPKCKRGTLVARTLKKGRNEGEAFLGCSNYPKCDFFAWAQ